MICFIMIFKLSKLIMNSFDNVQLSFIDGTSFKYFVCRNNSQPIVFSNLYFIYFLCSRERKLPVNFTIKLTAALRMMWVIAMNCWVGGVNVKF